MSTVVIQVVYGAIPREDAAKITSGYAFRTDGPVALGDLMQDDGQWCTVVALESDYAGPMRSIRSARGPDPREA